MIEELRLNNWKSYGNSTLYIEPLTFVIGFNASGKSNILDALHFLSLIARGKSIDDAARSIRGGEDWVVRKDQEVSTISVKVYDEANGIEYVYSIGFSKTGNAFKVVTESLSSSKKTTNKDLFSVAESAKGSADVLPVTTYRPKAERKTFELSNESACIYQLSLLFSAGGMQKDVSAGVTFVCNKLKNIFTLNPIPSAMRKYSSVQNELKEDASNIAGVIANIIKEGNTSLQTRIAELVKPLPERDIVEVWAETGGLFDKDAILCCKEKWTDDKELVMDAKSMSDGTLRFIAIITALLTIPSGTLLLIEEVDNGLHPSRVSELITALRNIGEERGIDIICTTHNPHMIDSLGAEMISNISYVKRSPVDGTSEIFLLDEKEDLVQIMAGGSIGSSMIKGRI